MNTYFTIATAVLSAFMLSMMACGDSNQEVEVATAEPQKHVGTAVPTTPPTKTPKLNTPAPNAAPALPPDYDESNTHMVQALEHKNQFVQWMNDLPAQGPKPTTEEWLGALRMLERAITEAKLVSQDFLQRAHTDLPEMWEGFFIPSMEGIHLYYFNSVTDPDSVKLPSTDEGMEQLNTLLDARTNAELWGDWFDSNRDSIRAGIRKLAK